MQTGVATIKSVQSDGTFDSKYGMLYSFEYELDNGVVLKANHKKPEPIESGERVEFTVKGQNDYGKYGSVKRHFQGPGEGFGSTSTYKDNTKGIKVGHAINNAVILCGQLGTITRPSSGEELGLKDSIKEYAKLIYEISEELNNEL